MTGLIASAFIAGTCSSVGPKMPVPGVLLSQKFAVPLPLSPQPSTAPSCRSAITPVSTASIRTMPVAAGTACGAARDSGVLLPVPSRS